MNDLGGLTEYSISSSADGDEHYGSIHGEVRVRVWRRIHLRRLPVGPWAVWLVLGRRGRAPCGGD